MYKAILVSIRPRQWTKNLFLFAALLFTGNIFNISMILKSCLAFVVFCGLSSAIYLINDILDKSTDRFHPKKKHRPIVSGRLSVRHASIAAVLISATSIALSLLLPLQFTVCAIVYCILLNAYSIYFKSIIIIDAIVVSLGFVIRLLAGGFAIAHVSSQWSIIMTFFLAVFLSLVKRRVEKEALGDIAVAYRKNLGHYRKESLDYIIIIAATSVIISYSLFTLFAGKSPYLYTTIPFVLYGIFRYIFLAFEKNRGADPSVLFVKDRPLFYDILCWAASSAVIIYLSS